MNYLILKNSLTLNYDGNTTNINREDGRYDTIIKLIKEGKLDEIIPLLDTVKVLEQEGFNVEHGVVHIEGEPLPDTLSKRVLDFYDNNLPYEPLLKFWKKLKTNPSFNSRLQLFKFLEHNGHPITSEGNFIAYRSVTKDFKDFHTRKFDNSVGTIVEMSRSLVDDNPNNTCSSGLHVATMSYAKDFGDSDRTIVDVEVDPADVVSVPTDYNGTKMRVCKFKVVAVTKGVIDKPLVRSSYETEEYLCQDCGAKLEDDSYEVCDYCVRNYEG